MLGWEFPPFMSGGLGVHCENLSKKLVAEGVEVDFFLPQNACRIESGGVKLVPVYYSEKHASMNASTADPYYKLRQEMSFVASKKDFLRPLRGKPAGKVDRYNARVARKIAERHARKPYDLVHVHGRFNLGAAVMAKHLTGLPFVWTVHSTAFDEAVEAKVDDWQYNFERVGGREADRIIAVSKRTKSQLNSRFGLKSKKISVIYNGIDAKRFASGRSARHLRSEVLFHGRLTNQKGPKYFLLAARDYLSRFSHRARFVMSGKGHLGDNLERFSRELRINRSVSFPGFIPERRLPAVYSESDVFVLPSVSEPFGITVLEAAAAGVPAVISKTCGVGEVLKSCLKVDYWDVSAMADKVHDLLTDDGLYNRLSERSRAAANRLSWDRIAGETAGVYAGV